MATATNQVDTYHAAKAILSDVSAGEAMASEKESKGISWKIRAFCFGRRRPCRGARNGLNRRTRRDPIFSRRSQWGISALKRGVFLRKPGLPVPFPGVSVLLSKRKRPRASGRVSALLSKAPFWIFRILWRPCRSPTSFPKSSRGPFRATAKRCGIPLRKGFMRRRIRPRSVRKSISSRALRVPQGTPWTFRNAHRVRIWTGILRCFPYWKWLWALAHNTLREQKASVLTSP